jgi:hypothetical protein
MQATSQKSGRLTSFHDLAKMRTTDKLPFGDRKISFFDILPLAIFFGQF